MSKKKLSEKQAQKICALAKEQYEEEGCIEIAIPSGAAGALEMISGSDTYQGIVDEGGVYVKAWVWVSLDEDILKDLEGK